MGAFVCALRSVMLSELLRPNNSQKYAWRKQQQPSTITLPTPREQRAPPSQTLPGPLQVEKYRPRVVADVVGNVEAVARLRVIAEEGNMPNMILAVRVEAVCAAWPRFARACAAHTAARTGVWC